MNNAVRNLDGLKLLPFFAALTPATFDRLAPSIRIDRYRKGETLVRQGDKASSVFIVVEGFIKLSRVSAHGEETVIRIFGRGETMGESVALLGDSHTTTAEAVGPATVARIPSPVVAQIAREAPELTLAILTESSNKIWQLMDEIETLKAQNADQRVLRFVLSLCPPGADGYVARLPYTKGDIAASLGLKQETLSRSFARLKAVGVDIDGREVKVASAAALSAEIDRLNRIV